MILILDSHFLKATVPLENAIPITWGSCLPPFSLSHGLAQGCPILVWIPGSVWLSDLTLET